ncbi:MAG: LysR family transcriptional regulator [Acuticoccus sp.]
MDYRVAEYLIAVARAGSLRAAADELGVTQPTLTKAVRRLEDEIGASVFHRTARGVTLTIYGEAVLRHARAIKASVREAHEEVAALKQGLGGRVRIGAGPSWQRSVLPEAIEAFRKDWPRVHLEIVGGMDDQLKAQLRAGKLDIVLAAMSGSVPVEPDLTGHSLIDDEYGIIARASHPLARRKGPIALETLTQQQWILPGRGSMLVLRLAAIFQAHGLPAPEAIVETDLSRLKLLLMSEADYLSFHALNQLRELDPGPIVPLSVPNARWRRAAGLMMRRGLAPGPAVTAMMGAIEKACARARETADPA